MKKRVLAVVLMAFAGLSTSPAPAQTATAQPATHEAAFTLYRDKIIVPVEIGGKTFTGVYDSGAGTSVLSAAAAAQIGAAQSGTARLSGFGGATRGQIARSVEARIGDARHTYAMLPVADLSPFTVRFGRAIDFLIGVDSFPDDVVEVDWAASKLRWTPRAAFRAPAGAVDIKFDRRNGVYRTSVAINGVQASANVDLGSGDALTVSDRLADRAALRAVSTTQITGIGGDAQVGLGSLTDFALAGAAFRDVPFVREESRMLPGGVDANIGLPLLARYRVFLDYRAEQAWLAPIPERTAPAFARNTTGLRVGRPAPDRLIVLFVSDPSPAKAAGFVGGEEIVALDGVPVSALAPDADPTAWTRAPGEGVLVLKLADGREVTIARSRFY